MGRLLLSSLRKPCAQMVFPSEGLDVASSMRPTTAVAYSSPQRTGTVKASNVLKVMAFSMPFTEQPIAKNNRYKSAESGHKVRRSGDAAAEWQLFFTDNPRGLILPRKFWLRPRACLYPIVNLCR